MSPITDAIVANNMTQLHGTAESSSSSSSTAKPFPFPPSPQWGPDDIGTLVFGLIASILGVLTLWATFWLRRRRALHAGEDDEGRETESTSNESFPLEDIVVERHP